MNTVRCPACEGQFSCGLSACPRCGGRNLWQAPLASARDDCPEDPTGPNPFRLKDEATGGDTAAVRVFGLMLVLVAAPLWFWMLENGHKGVWHTVVLALAVGGAYALIAGKLPYLLGGSDRPPRRPVDEAPQTRTFSPAVAKPDPASVTPEEGPVLKFLCWLVAVAAFLGTLWYLNRGR